MAKIRWTGLVLVAIVSLAALGVALGVNLGRVGQSAAGTLTLTSSAVLSTGDLGLWHDRGKTNPVTSLHFDAIALQPPLRSIVTPVEVFVENLSTADRFLVKPCGALVGSATAALIGTMDAVVHDLGGKRLGNTCDSPPTVKLTAGNLVRAELHIDLAPGLGSGDFSFETVFEAVLITADATIDPPAGMVSWWPGDGNAQDIIDGNDGTLSGDAGFLPGKVGQAFSFDGTGDFIEVPHNAGLNLPQFSIDVWVFINPALNAGEFNAFVGKSNGSSAGGGFWLAHDDRNFPGDPTTDGALDFAVISGPSVFSRAFLPNAFTDARFYHLAGTFDGSQARLYLDGSLVDTGPAIPGIAFNTLPLRIGAINLKEAVGVDDRFEGLIDEVELFNRALTEAEIRAIFKAGSAGKIKPQPVEPPAGMVSWWSADGHAMDIVDGNDGALQNGATFASGMVGHAFSLDGVDDRVVVPHSGDLNITDAVTLDAWIKPDSLACPGGWCAVVAKSDVSNIKRNYGLWVRSNGQLWLSYINTGGAERLLASSAGTITIGTFQHVAGVIDTVSGTMRVFKNGVEMGSAPASGAMAVNTEPLTIGFADPGIGNDFNGLIDEVEVFNRALSEAEIRAIFKAGKFGKIKPPPGPLEPPAGMVSWWPGDGNAQDIIDGNDGTLSGDAGFVPGKVGQAFSFDGTGDFVLVPDSPNLNITSDVTVDLWAKRSGTGTSYLVSKGAGAIEGVDVPSAYEIRFNADNRIRALFERANGSNVQLIGPTPTDTAFHHYAYVRGGDNHKLFIDGVVVTAAAFTGTPGDTSGLPLVIGALRSDFDPTGFFGHFAGIIDEVEVFNRALSDAEIKAIFEAGSAGKRKPQLVEPPAGMVSWWPGDGNASDIMDGNHGTLTGDATATADGMVGQAFSFDGAGDFVSISSRPSLEPEIFTIDAWIKPSSLPGTPQIIVTKWGTVGFARYELAITSNSKFVFVVHKTDNTNVQVISNSSAQVGVWKHVAGAFTGTSLDLYVDGILDSSINISGTLQSSHNPFAIGANFRPNDPSPFTGEFFHGLIDEVELFNRALSAAEIRAIFDAGSAGKRKPSGIAPPAGMVSWWPGEGNASDIQDGNHGTLSGDAGFAPGKVGQAFRFNGTSANVQVPNAALDNLLAGTIDMWINPSANSPGAAIGFGSVWFGKQHDFVNSVAVFGFSSPSESRVRFHLQNAAPEVTGTNPLALNEWHHVAATWDGASIKVYVNGVKEGEVASSATLPSDLGASTAIGAWLGGGNSFFTGSIDEVEIFNRALSAAEIRAIFEAGSAGKRKPSGIAPPAGMLSWWPGDGNSSDIMDGNHGTLTGDAGFAPGNVGQAFSFNGVAGRVATAIDPFSTAQLGTSGSMDAWVNFSSLPPLNEGATTTDIEGFVQIGYGKINVDAAERLKCRLFDGQEKVVNTILPDLNRWYHVAVTWDGTAMKCYLDGVLQGTVAAGGIDPDILARPFSMGAASHDPTLKQFHGSIDEVEIFDRALTEAEIRAIFDAGSAGKRKPSGIAPPAGMVSWWPGDGNARDIVDGNHGTLNGSTFAAGKVGQAFSLDGIDDLVLVPDSANLKISGDITVDAWIMRGVGSIFPTLISKYESDPAGGGTAYTLLLLSGDTPNARVRFAVYQTKDGAISRFTDTDLGVVPADVWTHVAGTFDLATQTTKIYVNGIEASATLDPSSLAITSISPSTAPLRIGAIRGESGAVSGFFDGLIDEVEIFNRALSAAEIRAIFDAGSAGKRKP